MTLFTVNEELFMMRSEERVLFFNRQNVSSPYVVWDTSVLWNGRLYRSDFRKTKRVDPLSMSLCSSSRTKSRKLGWLIDGSVDNWETALVGTRDFPGQVVSSVVVLRVYLMFWLLSSITLWENVKPSCQHHSGEWLLNYLEWLFLLVFSPVCNQTLLQLVKRFWTCLY